MAASMDDVVDAIGGLADVMKNTMGVGGAKSEAEGLASRLESMASTLGNLKGGGPDAAKLANEFTLLGKRATDVSIMMSDATRQMAALQAKRAATTDVSEINKINQEMQKLAQQMETYNSELTDIQIETNGLNDQFKLLTGNVDKSNKALSELTRKMNQSPIDALLEKMFGEEQGKVVKELLMKLWAPIGEAIKIAQEGIRRASQLGISAAEGVALEFSTRVKALSSVANAALSGDVTRMVSMEQLQGTTNAASEALIGLREGTDFSAEGIKQFTVDLQQGFNSEFTLTAESMRALATAGATTATDFEDLRKATGRASLSSGQLSQIVNKNQLSVLLFGTSVLKAAADADKLGISLSAIQKGQESFVTGLDNGLDTIAQLNQLGAGLDFGTLTQLAEFGSPDQVLAYVKSAVPTEMLNSSSMRALLGQLMPGIDAETLLKLEKPASAMDKLEAAVTKQADATGKLTELFTGLGKSGTIWTSTFNTFFSAIVAATMALLAFARVGGVSGIKSLFGGGGPAPAPVPPTGGGVAGGVPGAGFNAMTMLQGAAALLVLAGALYVAGKALQQFNTVDWPSLGKAALAIGGMTLAMMALGAVMASGIGGGAILAGIGTLALMAGVLAITGLSLMVVGSGFKSFAEGLSQFNAAIEKINLAKITAFSLLLPVLSTAGIGFAVAGITTPAPPTTTTPPVTTPAPQVTRANVTTVTATEQESPKIDKLVARIDALITSIDGAKTIIDLGDNRRVEQQRIALAGAFGRYERV
jgi:hypothetical protein